MQVGGEDQGRRPAERLLFDADGVASADDRRRRRRRRRRMSGEAEPQNAALVLGATPTLIVSLCIIDFF